MQDQRYTERVKEQINQYAAVENMHGQLADIFRYWQQKYFKPRLSDVCQVNNHLEFYGRPLAERIQRTGIRDVISFGCGDAQVEAGVADWVRKSGVPDFRFHCVELSPKQIARASENVAKSGMKENFVFVQDDFNKWMAGEQKFAGAMCHHALHHVVELEHLLGQIRQSLHEDGVFASIDVIGRNGHMRWPEALALIERIWAFLPEEKKFHHLLKQAEPIYRNRDCSNQGFEGIRAQDILPTLVENFGFESFLGFGNLIDVFTSRGFGANYDADDDLDRAFIDFIEYLNELLIDIGYLKPTRMCAVMVRDRSATPRTYKHWDPQFCVREPDRLS